jgi:uncharacterized damage-inducible protein DinB
MTPATRLQKLFDYDKWACLRILAVLEENQGFKLRTEAASMFGHIVSSQLHWFSRISETPLEQTKLWPGDDLSKYRQQLETICEKWAVLIADNESNLDRNITYQNSKGVSYSNLLSDILHHVIIHGQHHRAQIASMLRRSEIVPPATDFIFYARQTT